MTNETTPQDQPDTTAAQVPSDPGALSTEELLAQLAIRQGVSISSLQSVLHEANKHNTTVADFVAKVLKNPPGAVEHTYGPYLRRLAADPELANVPMALVSHLQLMAFVQRSTAHAITTRGNRRNAREGRSATENAVGALRWLTKMAVLEQLRTDNPAAALSKGQRPRTPRRGLDTTQLQELMTVTANGGDDPALDKLLVRFFLESGARRAGVLNLRLRDLDHETGVVRLREKNDPDGSPQPISLSLMAALEAFAKSRGSRDPEDPVFRYRPRRGTTTGKPLTRRRFNTLADRWQSSLPWAARLGVTPHTLRHTGIGLVEYVSGVAVAREFARHRDVREVTFTYLNRELSDVAHAVQQLTGEPHPLAHNRFGTPGRVESPEPTAPHEPDSDVA